MTSRSIPFVAGAGVLVLLLLPGAALPAPQQVQFDPQASARDYVRFLVTEISQWTRDFPQRFYTAATQPPVDSSKLSDAVKASADQLGTAVKQLSQLSGSNDLLTDTAFKDQLDKSLAAAKLVNQALGSQRFPEVLENDWAQIRTNLNSLAQIYKLESLAYLAPPASGGGRPGGAAAASAKVPPPGALVGYIVDKSCSLKGKGMWTNAECIARCIRDGDKAVLVTEDGKIFQIANQEKIDSDTYGQKVTVTGKLDGDTITVASIGM